MRAVNTKSIKKWRTKNVWVIRQVWKGGKNSKRRIFRNHMIMTDPMIDIFRDMYSFAGFSRSENSPKHVIYNLLSTAKFELIIIKRHSVRRGETRKQESWYRVWNRDRQTMEAQLKHRAAPNLISLIDSRGWRPHVADYFRGKRARVCTISKTNNQRQMLPSPPFSPSSPRLASHHTRSDHTRSDLPATRNLHSASIRLHPGRATGGYACVKERANGGWGLISDAIYRARMSPERAIIRLYWW